MVLMRTRRRPPQFRNDETVKDRAEECSRPRTVVAADHERKLATPAWKPILFFFKPGRLYSDELPPRGQASECHNRPSRTFTE
jgi:hypothetical protein